MTDYAIDPGPHTAIFWMAETPTVFEPRAVTLDFTLEGMLKLSLKQLYFWLMHEINPTKDRIVCESFEFRKEDAQNREYIDYSTGEYVGVVKLFCQLTDTPYQMQSASEGKGFWDNDKLKRVGLYKYCADRHQRDACRHWLHDTTFRGGNNYYLNLLK